MAKKLKVGIIGVGGIAKTHIPGWNDSEHAELVAMADLSPEILNKTADQFGVKIRYNDPQELIDDPDIDIIDICTPNMYHAPLSIKALNAGKHVLCEKPLAPTPDAIREMIKARDDSGKLLMTAQHFRWHPKVKALRAEVEKGTLGEVYHARSWLLRRYLLPARPGFILKQHSGGGPCIDIGVHVLDLTLWMMGHPKPVTVTGVTQARLAKQEGAFSRWGAVPPEMDVEEFAAAFVRFDNGASLILEVAWMLHHDTAGEDMQVWLYGDNAGAHYPTNQFITADNANKQHINFSLQIAEGMEPHAAECVEFARCVAEKLPSPVPAEESLQVQSILDGLYKSAESGREVVLED